MELILSENSEVKLLSALRAHLSDPSATIEGKKVSGYADLKVERKGVMYNCYQVPERSCIDDWKRERDRLWITRDNIERLKELQQKIDYIEYGIL